MASLKEISDTFRDTLQRRGVLEDIKSQLRSEMLQIFQTSIHNRSTRSHEDLTPNIAVCDMNRKAAAKRRLKSNELLSQSKSSSSLHSIDFDLPGAFRDSLDRRGSLEIVRAQLEYEVQQTLKVASQSRQKRRQER